MPSRDEIAYFGAGPALLPTTVLQAAASALVNFNDTGLGIAEHSHRSSQAAKVVSAAKSNLARFLNVPTATHEILFLQGGGCGEFSAVVLNLVGNWVARQLTAGRSEHDLSRAFGRPSQQTQTQLGGKTTPQLVCDYVVTGGWSAKAAEEAARLLGPEFVNVAADARKRGSGGQFGMIPPESEWALSPDAAFVYMCDNETVDGVEFPAFPSCLSSSSSGSDPIVVADMSSNILSRPVPWDRLAVVFFGAQKNMGIAGITVAVVRRDLVAQPDPAVLRRLGLPVPPAVLTWETIAKNDSLYNTLSIFDVYIINQVLEGLLSTYTIDGIVGQQAVSARKASLIYSALDAHPAVYHVVPAPEVRSRMNVCFRVMDGDEQAEKRFLDEASQCGLQGLKGHRSVGGIRASLYNAVTMEAVQKLEKFLHEFAASVKGGN